MADDVETTQRLRVLVANEQPDRLDELVRVVEAAGHTVVARTLDVAGAGLLAHDAQPDVTFVAAGPNIAHALEQIETIVEEANCPVIIVLDENDPEFVAQAARRGVFGHASDASPEDLQSSIEVALRRFTELRELEDAFRRRAIVERAKGILMERHGIDEKRAFDRMRTQARARQVRIVAVAEDVLGAHRSQG